MNPFILTLKTYNLNVEIHKHSAYQIVLSENNPFDSIIDNEKNESIYGFLIQPNVPHLCTADNSSLFIINIEPYSSAGFYIQSKFQGGSNRVIFNSKNKINQFFEIQDSAIESVLQSIVTHIKVTYSDERVVKMIDYISENYFSQEITPDFLGDLVFLSPSRLSALFKQQTGSSLSKYLLWTRLRRFIYSSLFDKKKALTDIAIDTGFYDLPQLNKYMYAMFGVPPKALRQNSDLIQVLEK